MGRAGSNNLAALGPHLDFRPEMPRRNWAIGCEIKVPPAPRRDYECFDGRELWVGIPCGETVYIHDNQAAAGGNPDVGLRIERPVLPDDGKVGCGVVAPMGRKDAMRALAARLQWKDFEAAGSKGDRLLGEASHGAPPIRMNCDSSPPVRVVATASTCTVMARSQC
jgi:hypothetical protein